MAHNSSDTNMTSQSSSGEKGFGYQLGMYAIAFVVTFIVIGFIVRAVLTMNV